MIHTVFCKDGESIVTRGPNFQSALQSYCIDKKNVDFHSNGVSLDYYWDKDKQKWVFRKGPSNELSNKLYITGQKLKDEQYQLLLDRTKDFNPYKFIKVIRNKNMVVGIERVVEVHYLDENYEAPLAMLGPLVDPVPEDHDYDEDDARYITICYYHVYKAHWHEHLRDDPDGVWLQTDSVKFEYTNKGMNDALNFFLKAIKHYFIDSSKQKFQWLNKDRYEKINRVIENNDTLRDNKIMYDSVSHIEFCREHGLRNTNKNIIPDNHPLVVEPL